MTVPAVKDNLTAGSAANLPALAGSILPGQAIDFGHLTPETSISLSSAGREYRLSARDVLRWVAPAAPISDAVKLLVIAQNTNLNPMLGEIELIEFGGKWCVFIRKAGHIRHAIGSPDYDGHESGVVVQVKDRSRLPEDHVGAITPVGYLLVGGWAKIWRKGVSRPAYKRVHLQDYDRRSGTWSTNPAVMIEKVAIAQALRESFPIGDSYDEAEGPDVLQATTSTPLSSAHLGSVHAVYIPLEARGGHLANVESDRAMSSAASSFVIEPEIVDDGPTPEPITHEQIQEIGRLAIALKMTDAQYHRMLDKRGVESSAELTAIQAREIIDQLEHRASRAAWDPLGNAAQQGEASPVVTPATDATDATSTVLPETTRA